MLSYRLCSGEEDGMNRVIPGNQMSELPTPRGPVGEVRGAWNPPQRIKLSSAVSTQTGTKQSAPTELEFGSPFTCGPS